MGKEDRGFASMDRNKQREIASKGGRAAHQKGTAHEWTRDEAREAGRKGGVASHRFGAGTGKAKGNPPGDVADPVDPLDRDEVDSAEQPAPGPQHSR